LIAIICSHSSGHPQEDARDDYDWQDSKVWHYEDALLRVLY
jgi:hypothetical protein